MARPELGLVSSQIKDPMLTFDFQLEFPDLPAGVGTSQSLLVHCQQAVKPGLTIESVVVELLGHSYEFAGRKVYSREMQITWYENVRGEIQRTFERWAGRIRSTQTQHGDFKAEYAKPAKLTIFDNKGNVPLIYTLFNTWPTTLPEIQFSGGESQAVLYGVGLKFDYYDKTGGYTA